MGNHSEPVSADALGQLEVLRHDGHPLGMDGAEVSVLEERHQVGLSSFLEGQDSLTLEPDLLFELSSNLTHQSLEGELPDQQVGLNKGPKRKGTQLRRVEIEIESYALLEFSDLSESNCSRFESVGLLHARDDRGGLPSDFLGGKLLAGHLLSGGLACGLLGSGHLQ